jgi:hypothetical protein
MRAIAVAVFVVLLGCAMWALPAIADAAVAGSAAIMLAVMLDRQAARRRA